MYKIFDFSIQEDFGRLCGYKTSELDWLKKEIKSVAYRNAMYKIVMIHMPVLKQEQQGYGMKFLADEFGPVLQNAGIDLAISAHTHRQT